MLGSMNGSRSSGAGWTRRIIIAMVACVLAFCWGFLAHRNEIFPYSIVRDLAVLTGLGDPDLPEAQGEGVKEFEPRLEALSVLDSLPYIDALPTERPQDRGVVQYDRERASEGLNFYNMTRKSRAILMDMSGQVVHEWHYSTGGRGAWHHAELLSDGGILIVVQDASLMRLDRDSNLVWVHEARAHHDLWVGVDGTIVFLGREAVVFTEVHPTIPVTDDRVIVLNAEGRRLDEFSLVKVMLASPYAFLLSSIAEREFADEVTEIDLLHANHIEVFDGDLADRSPLYAAGNFLVSMKNINAIAILERESHEVLWVWGPNNVVLQHHPVLQTDGSILLFDNGTEFSRVLELDPLSRHVTWSYEDGENFFSFWGGSSQRLPNGNTLITETARGQVFEVTSNGEVVWRFLNPDVDDKNRRWNIWRMTRYPLASLKFLQ